LARQAQESRVDIVCLDLEGVLIPEIWVNFAELTGIEALRATTREVPDYDQLMKFRLGILEEHKLGIRDIEKVIGTLKPLEGAPEFLRWLRSNYQLVILSDTYYEFAKPLMAQLEWPTLFCHRLEVEGSGRIIDYKLRLRDHKRKAVEAFKRLNFRTIAAGDSYNDTAMLGEADTGILFSPPQNVIDEFPQFQVTRSYDELKAAIIAASR
jgi:phosphoserine/homoserine phosphotransferase